MGEESHHRVVRVALLFPVGEMEGVATPNFLGSRLGAELELRRSGSSLGPSQ